MNNLNTNLDNLYKIGQVSRLAGIRVETLRAWDKRQQLVAETRVGSVRYYSKQQVERAKLIQSLIKSGLGYTIGTLSPKSETELRELHEQANSNPMVQAKATVDYMRGNNANIVVGWQLSKLRTEHLREHGSSSEQEGQTLDLGLYTLDQLRDFLSTPGVDNIGVAVVYLPSTWRPDSSLDHLRELFDRNDQTNCQIIAISPNSLLDRQQDEERVASKKGIKLMFSMIDGRELQWADIKNEIQTAEQIQVGEPDTQRLDIAQLCYLLSIQNQTVSGIQTADFVNCYEQLENLIGSVNRATVDTRGLTDSTAIELQKSLRIAIDELQPWLNELAEHINT